MLDNLSLDLQLLRAAYRTGTVSPSQVIALIYQRLGMETVNPVWITLRSLESVLASAQALEGQDPDSLPLWGIPFAVKDNIDVKDLPTTAACPAFSYTPSHHATVVDRLLQAGAILIGKTNLDQFATGLVGTRSPYGACPNSFNSEFISGGSSSGSAVAVTKGLVSFSLGTDTGGSGRVPAAFNNLVGLKPTRGLISTSGVVPACRSLDCVSIFALTVADAEQVMAIAAGFDPTDSYSRPSPKPVTSLTISPSNSLNTFPNRPQSHLPDTSPSIFPTGFRFGVPSLLNFFGDRAYEKLYHQSLQYLEQIGGTAVTIDFTPFSEATQLLFSGAWVVERYTALKAFVTTHDQAILPILQTILNTALNYSASDVFTDFHRLAALQQQTNLVWQQIDVLAVPTTGTIYRTAEIAADPIALNANLGYYTSFVNLLDLAAIALPAGFRNDGLPFGVTLIAPAFSDAYLCDLGKFYEQARQAIAPALSTKRSI